jgi:hypothetical protein
VALGEDDQRIQVKQADKRFLPIAMTGGAEKICSVKEGGRHGYRKAQAKSRINRLAAIPGNGRSGKAF